MVNLQALTMLPGASSSNYSSKMKQPSPLATKRMDARNGDGSRTDYAPSSRIPQSSRSTTKVKKSKQMNGLPTNLDFDFMNRGSLSQPVEDMTSELYYPRTKFSPEVVPVSYGETDGSNSRNFYRSASDESVYNTLRTSSRNSRTSKQVKDFNVKESRSWAKSFALSVLVVFPRLTKKRVKVTSTKIASNSRLKAPRPLEVKMQPCSAAIHQRLKEDFITPTHTIKRHRKSRHPPKNTRRC